MAATSYKDRISETSTFTGGGPVALLGAVNGFADFTRFAASQSGIPVLMEAIDAAHAPTGQWEVAMCTLSADRRTLTRDTVRDSSNAGATVSFAAGTKRVSVVNDGLSIENRLTPETGLEAVDASAEDWGPGVKLVLADGLIVGDQAAGQADIALFAGDSTYTGQLEIDNLDWSGAAVFGGRVTPEGRVPLVTAGAFTGFVFTDTPYVMADAVLTEATGLEVSEDTWWGSAPGLGKMFIGESLAVGDANVEGAARLVKGGGGFGPYLELDQPSSPTMPGSGLVLTIPETGTAGPVNFFTGGGAGKFSGYDFDGTITVSAAPTGPPYINMRSPGTRVVLSPKVDATHADVAIGVDNTSLWQSVPSLADNFFWYAGQTILGYIAGNNGNTTTVISGANPAVNSPALSLVGVNPILHIQGGSNSYYPEIKFSGAYGASSASIQGYGGLTHGVLDGLSHTFNVGSWSVAQFTNTGAAFSVAGKGILTVHSQGIRVDHATGCSIASGTAAAPSDVQIYFDSSNYYNTLTFRHFDASRYYTDAQIMSARDTGLYIDGYPSVVIRAGAVDGPAKNAAFFTTGNAIIYSPNIQLGDPWATAAADLTTNRYNTNYYFIDNWSCSRTGSQVPVAGRLISELVNGIRTDANTHTFRKLDGSHDYAILDDAGARFSVAGATQFNIHSQGFSVNNGSSCLIAAGTHAAPSDTVMYFDTTNYYNLFYFRYWDGSAYSTHGQIVGSRTDGVGLYGFPAINLYNGTSAAPKRAAYIGGDQVVFDNSQFTFGGTGLTNSNCTIDVNSFGTGVYTTLAFHHQNYDGTGHVQTGSVGGYSGYGFYVSGNPDLHLRCGPDVVDAMVLHELDATHAQVTVNGALTVAGPGAPLTINSTTSNGNKITLQDAGVNGCYWAGTVASPFEVSDAAGVPMFTVNSFKNVLVYNNLGVTGAAYVADQAYSSAWDGDLSVPTKNAVYDKIQTLGSGGGGTTTNPLTINNAGTGIASGGTFDGSVARTISYNSIGAAKAGAFSASLLTLNTAKIIGRTTAANGAPEEVGVDATMSLTALTLSVAKVPTALTVSNAGGGVASGSTFDGSVARTISYNSIGATRAGLATAGDLTMNTGKVLGRTTAAAGAIEELTPGATMTITAGALNVAKVPNALTGNNSGTGVASGGTYDGSAAVTFSWNTLGAAPDAPRTQAAAAESITPTFSNDVVQRLACVASITLNNPTGTAVDNWGLVVKLRSASAQALSYGTQYRAVGVVLPAATIAGKLLILGMIWNVTDTKFDVVAVAQEA